LNFASLQFAGFLLLVLVAHRAMPTVRLQNWVLLAFSYYFYACWDARLLALIWLVTGVTHGVALALHDPNRSELERKRILQGSLVFSLGILGTFKYFDFFSASLAEALGALGWRYEPLLLDLVLPAAISFYTFESISYVMGAYKRELKQPATLVEYALFIAFFPKLVAGPIERPNVLLPQIAVRRQATAEQYRRGVYLIVLGLFKKVAIADGLAPFVSSVYEGAGPHSAQEVALSTLAFAFQIYGDFSGYSDIARGCSLLFGIDLSWNFSTPYFSKDPSEFWRRWHISLSSWLRDYVYIPFGGNRKGDWVTYRNLFYTMLIGGLWHGAAWTFVAWGAFHGGMLAVHKALTPVLQITGQHSNGLVRHLHAFVAWAVFFVLTCYGWLLFRATSIGQVFEMSTALANWDAAPLALNPPPLSALLGVPVLIVHDAWSHVTGRHYAHEAWPAWARGLLYAALLTLIAMGAANSRSAFIYFQF
jgi:alginate O-acetyltransferase complex protein AlgI